MGFNKRALLYLSAAGILAFVLTRALAGLDVPGAQGPAGIPGSKIWVQSGVPAPSLGADSDVYTNTLTANVYQKDSSGWQGPLMNLQGPQGATGSQGNTGSQGSAGATGAQGNAGAIGAQGSTGATGASGTNGTNGTNGAAGVNAFSAYNIRSVSLATAYQATDITKPAIVTINITSTASFSLSGGTTNTANIVVGSTNGVAGGTGTVTCPYSNSVTGTIAVGLNMNSVATLTCTVALPAGWFFAVRQTAGAIAITSAFDQSVG